MSDNKLAFIENELKKFNMTDAAIDELSKKYMPLIINDIHDKESYKMVNEARRVMKNYRIDIDKRRKELNADALQYQRRINGEAKRITALLEPIESHLAAEEKKVDDEIERIKREKEEAEAIRYQVRMTQLLSLDFKFDGVKFITDYFDTFNDERMQIAVLHLKQMDDAAFNCFFDNAKHYYDIEQKAIADRERLRQETIAQEEAERKAQNEFLAIERARLEAIAKEQEAKDTKLKAEQEQIDREKAKLNESILSSSPVIAEKMLESEISTNLITPDQNITKEERPIISKCESGIFEIHRTILINEDVIASYIEENSRPFERKMSIEEIEEVVIRIEERLNYKISDLVYEAICEVMEERVIT